MIKNKQLKPLAIALTSEHQLVTFASVAPYRRLASARAASAFILSFLAYLNVSSKPSTYFAKAEVIT